MCEPISFVTTRTKEVFYLPRDYREYYRNKICHRYHTVVNNLISSYNPPPEVGAFSYENSKPIFRSKFSFSSAAEEWHHLCKYLSCNFDSHSLICEHYQLDQDETASFELDLVQGRFVVDKESKLRDDDITAFTKQKVNELSLDSIDPLVVAAANFVRSLWSPDQSTPIVSTSTGEAIYVYPENVRISRYQGMVLAERYNILQGRVGFVSGIPIVYGYNRRLRLDLSQDIIVPLSCRKEYSILVKELAERGLLGVASKVFAEEAKLKR